MIAEQSAARGAQAGAIIYSVVETAKENGLNPRAYLQYLFEQLPNRDLQDPSVWANLLPWSPQLPDRLKAPQPPSTAKLSPNNSPGSGDYSTVTISHE